MKKWLPWAFWLLVISNPAASRAQWSPAWVAFHGIDVKHLQYSFKGLDLGTNTWTAGVRDPKGNVTVMATWSGGPPPEGTYRLANTTPGIYSVVLASNYRGGPMFGSYFDFSGKAPNISGTPLFDESIDGASYTNVDIGQLKVSTNLNLAVQNVRSTNRVGDFEIIGSLLLQDCWLTNGNFVKANGKLQANDCTIGELNVGLKEVSLTKCQLGPSTAFATNGIFKATDCTFDGQGEFYAAGAEVRIEKCGIFLRSLFGYLPGVTNYTPLRQPIGSLRVEDCVFLSTNGPSEVTTLFSQDCQVNKCEFYKTDLVLALTNVPPKVTHNVFMTCAMQVPWLRPEDKPPLVEQNSFWGAESVKPYGINLGIYAFAMADNYWGGLEGPRTGPPGYTAGGWLDSMGTHTPFFNGADPVRPEGEKTVSSVMFDKPMPFPDIWVEGRRAGQNSLTERGQNARRDRDTLVSYDLRASVPILFGPKFWLECNGRIFQPVNRGYTLQRDYGAPDVGPNNQNRTLNFIIPAGTDNTALNLQLWGDTSGINGYSPKGRTNSLDTPWSIALIPPPVRPLRIGFVPVNFGGKVPPSTVDFSDRLARDLEAMTPLRRQLSEIEMISLPPVDFHGWWWSDYFSTSFINEIVATFSSYLTERNASHTKQLDFLAIIVPVDSPLGPNGANAIWDRRLMLLAEGQEDAAIHEFGHALGLYTGSEQYSVINSCAKTDFTMVCGVGARVMGVTAFQPDGSAHRMLPNRFRHFPFTQTLSALDVMSGDTDVPEPHWMIPSTYSAFASALRRLLWMPPAAPLQIGPSPPSASKGLQASAATNAFVRILFRGLCTVGANRVPALLPKTVICSDVTSTVQKPITGDQRLDVYLDVLNRTGIPVPGGGFAQIPFPILNETPATIDWTQTFDVPLDPDPFWAPVRYELRNLSTGELLFVQTKSDSLSNSLQGPVSGSALGSNLHLAWNASITSASGTNSRLQNQLYVSTDGKNNWTPILGSGFNSQMDLPTAFLPAGTGIAFKLVTSDGFRSSESILDNLVMNNRAPVVLIRSPRSGDQGLTNALWLLEAAVTDLEDQEIAAGQWVSSLDGALGSGLKLSDVALSPGTHTLSFSARDSQQAESRAEVLVTVVRTQTVDLAVRAETLVIRPRGLDPAIKLANQLRIGREHTILATVRNQGITNAADLKIFIREPGRSEALLTEKRLEWLPFATGYADAAYTPAVSGEYRFRVELQPVGLGDSNPGNNQYTWTITNLPPQAVSLSLDVNSTAGTAIHLLGNDPEQNAVTFAIVNAPKHGTLSGTPPDVVYASMGYAGPDSFTFKVNDGAIDSAEGMITLNVKSSAPAQFTIVAGAGSGGAITPAGPTVVNQGDNFTFTAKPNTNPNFEVDKWYLNGAYVQNGGTSFTLANVQNNGRVDVTFFEPSVARNMSVIAGAYGRTANVPIRLFGKGKENQFGFGLSWRPNILRFETARLSQPLAAATLEMTTNSAALGTVGIKIRLPQGIGLAAGTTELLRVEFSRVQDGWSPVGFTDGPALRSILDTTAVALPALWLEATVFVDDVPNIPELKAGPLLPGILDKTGFPFDIAGPRNHQYRTEYSSNLQNWILLRIDSPSIPGLSIADPGATNKPKRFYRVLMQP